jgi:hypothetical protein
MNWKEQYQKEALGRSRKWSRVRGGTKKPVHIILHKKHDSMSNVFSRCKFCHTGLKIRGVCVKCEVAELCYVCKKIVQPDRSALSMVYNHSKATHGLCFHCNMIEKRKLMDLVLEEKHEI